MKSKTMFNITTAISIFAVISAIIVFIVFSALGLWGTAFGFMLVDLIFYGLIATLATVLQNSKNGIGRI